MALNNWPNAVKEVRRLRAENERLREALKQVEFTCAPGLTHDSARYAVTRARGIATQALRVAATATADDATPDDDTPNPG